MGLDDRLRLGLVGCGGISRSVYVNLLTGFADRATVVAVCDLMPERAEDRSAQFRDAYQKRGDGAAVAAPRVYTDVARMVGDGGLDAVIVRPLGAVATVTGLAFFAISAPLVAPSGNIPVAWEVFFLGPYEYTFVRPLGDL